MPSWCVVPRCSSGKSGHRFPRDESMIKKWLIAIRRESLCPSKESIVCKDHFNSEDFTHPIYSPYPNSYVRLKKGAVPSVFSWNNDQLLIETNSKKKRGTFQNDKERDGNETDSCKVNKNLCIKKYGKKQKKSHETDSRIENENVIIKEEIKYENETECHQDSEKLTINEEVNSENETECHQDSEKLTINEEVNSENETECHQDSVKLTIKEEIYSENVTECHHDSEKLIIKEEINSENETEGHQQSKKPIIKKERNIEIHMELFSKDKNIQCDLGELCCDWKGFVKTDPLKDH